MTDDASSADLLGQIADEFVEAFRRGRRPSVEEFARRYPAHADDIREMLPALVLMEEAKSADDTSGQRRRARASAAAAPLQQLGDYQILREIGRGGMGVVYEAQQLSLGRHVAIKVLPAHALLDPRQLGRFRREAKAAARLHHTNIVPVFGVGEQDGLHYYVMQFIPGLGLDLVLEELQRLQPGKPGHGSTSGLTDGEPRVSRKPVSSTDLARSLTTGRFTPAGGKHDDAPAPRSDSTTPAAAGAPADPAPREGASVAGRLSDSFSPSSSVVLPGTGRQAGKRPLTYWQSVARIGAQVADALEYAHRQGIRHRDIKPSNLLLDTTGTVWVTDFGLAKADDQQNLTHTGDILGTLRYMPPEAFDGRADARGDVYSLGLTLYELLALRPAFNEQERSRLVKQVTTEEPARLDRLNRGVPRDLVTIVHKAISKEPGRRYQTAGSLAADLQRFLDDQPILARRSSLAERSWRWCRRNPLVASLAAAVVVLLALGTAFSTYFAIDATLAKARADAEALNARNKAAEAEENAQRKAAEQKKAVAEKERADREADAARTNLYLLRVNMVGMALDSGNPAQARDLLELLHPGPRSDQAPGWEWNYYWRFCHNDRRTFQGHSGTVSGVDYSPDGARLASSSDDGSVRLWDVATGQQLKCLALKKMDLPCVAFSPDGARLAVGCGDGTVRVLDAAGLQELSALTGNAGRVGGLRFSPDGARLVTISAGGRLKTWDLTAARELRTFQQPAGSLQCVAVSPDGKWLALGGQGGAVRLLDAASGQEVRTFGGHAGGTNGVAFSPDGKRLASTGMDRAVRVWDVASGQVLRELLGHASEVRSVAFSPDGKRLASGGHDQMLKVWDIESGQEVASYLGHTHGLYRVAFSPDGRSITSGSSDKTINVWDAAYRPGPRILKAHVNQVRGVAFEPDGRRLVSVGLDGQIKQWDVRTGQELPSLHGPGPGLLCLAISPDGRLLATGGDPGVVTVLDARTGRTVWAVEGHASWLNRVAFSPDSRLLASGGHDQTIKLWDAATGRELRALKGHKGGVDGLVFNADGTRLFSGGSDKTVKEWDPASGQELRTLKHGHAITDVALSPDGRLLASADTDNTVRLWDLASGQPVRTLTGHKDTVFRVAFHPGGTRLATAGWDQTVRLWDTATGHELASLKGHADRVLGVAFSPDGGFLASAGGADLTVRVWDGLPVPPTPPQEPTPARGTP
jgi:WD40 repeat protein/serine/threonine protein kinase